MSITQQNVKKVNFELETMMHCPLCHSSYFSLYSNLKDHTGLESNTTWQWSQCDNHLCQSLFLNPRPNIETIYMAYENYYTYKEGNPLTLKTTTNHNQESAEKVFSPNPTSPSLLKSIINGFVNFTKETLRFLFNGWIRWTPIARLRQETEFLGLQDSPMGSVLEIGCGSADRLAKLKKIGWTVYGQDIDPKAVSYAKEKHHIQIFCDPVNQLPLQEQSMDAVVLSHVIEHVHDPKIFIEQSLKYLKPNGLLILITPNSSSFIYSIFRSNWFALEHPRHLILFNPLNIQKILPEALRSCCLIKTSPGNAQFTALYSSEILFFGKYNLNIKTHFTSNLIAGFLQLLALVVWWLNPLSGEELILSLQKKQDLL